MQIITSLSVAFFSMCHLASGLFDPAIAVGTKIYTQGHRPHHYPDTAVFTWDLFNLTMTDAVTGDIISEFFRRDGSQWFENRVSKLELRGHGVVGKADLSTDAPTTLHIQRSKGVIDYK